LFSITDQYPIV